jgi:hypothetical protein
MTNLPSRTALLQHLELHSGHDALNMLHAAATTIQNQAIHESRAAHGGTSMNAMRPTTAHGGRKVTDVNHQRNGSSRLPGRNDTLEHDSNTANAPHIAIEQSPQSILGIKAWSRFRFVKAGWFTAQEGIAYITYFYKYLCPLTPITLPDFRTPETHKRLLEEEPMLALTMLLIASRHMKLKGPGSNSRPYAIHDTLWTYLSGMISRVMWGQEQFGGGLCGAGAEKASDVNPLSRKGMRTLGSVESLVLLTEWHPRAMHFPPSQDDNDLMTPESTSGLVDMADANETSKGIGGQRMDAWLEPCWRSDRMCWMLLGMAMTLAFEIGIFDSSGLQRLVKPTGSHNLPKDQLETYNNRRANVRDVLLVYVTQTSGRLGLTSMLPSSYNDPSESELHNRRIGPNDSPQDATLHFWLRMATLVKQGNTKVFPNKETTRNLIRTTKYREVLAELQPPLDAWRRDFNACKQIPKLMRSILLIEWEYARAYVMSLSLQAIAERCARDDVHPMDPPLEMARSVTKAGDIPMTPAALSQHFSGERSFVVKVAESARSVLKIVVEDLYPNDALKHAPVRTYFRIISVAILMFKTFVLGAFESDVSGSLSLLDQTIDALRTCIVDDVHVASRFAELLETLTNNLKPRLVRMAADGRGGRNVTSQRHSSRASPVPFHPDSNTNGNGTSTTTNNNHQGPGPYTTSFSADALAAMSSAQWTHPYGDATNHPLLGVSADTYDLEANNNAWSLMPPPGFNDDSPTNYPFQSHHPQQQQQQPNPQHHHSLSDGSILSPNTTVSAGGYNNNAFDDDHTNGGNTNGNNGNFPLSADDWLALPMDPLLNLSGADVTQTQFGLSLNGFDALDVLLSGNGGFQ